MQFLPTPDAHSKSQNCASFHPQNLLYLRILWTTPSEASWLISWLCMTAEISFSTISIGKWYRKNCTRCVLHTLYFYFEELLFSVVERGTNIAAKYMVDQLKHHQYQDVPILTEAPWSLVQNKRLHRILHNAFDNIIDQYQSLFVPVLLVEAEMASNFTQHASLGIYHLSRFGVLLRILGSGPDTSMKHHIAPMELFRVESDHIPTTQLPAYIFHAYTCYDISLRSFNPIQIFWFHHRNTGCRKW